MPRCGRLPLIVAIAVGVAACRDGTSADEPLAVTPATVNCAAGERVPLAARAGGRSTGAAFAVEGDGAWLTDVDRARGSATLACEAAGAGRVVVEQAGAQAAVDFVVRPPPDGTLRLTLAADTLALVNGYAAPLAARVTTTRPGVSTEARFRTADPTIATVDSVFGLVVSVNPGTTTVVAEARADRRVRASATVTISRGSLLAVGIATSPGALRLVVGDSGRVQATVQLADGAPAGTSREVRYASDDPFVAVVSAAGVVRGVGTGSTFIVASSVAAPRVTTRVAVSVAVPAPR